MFCVQWAGTVWWWEAYGFPPLVKTRGPWSPAPTGLESQVWPNEDIAWLCISKVHEGVGFPAF